MKRIIIITIISVLLLSLVSCVNTGNNTEAEKSDDDTSETVDVIVSEYFESVKSNENSDVTLFTPDNPYIKAEGVELVSASTEMEQNSVGYIVLQGLPDVQYSLSVYNEKGDAVIFTRDNTVNADENGRAIYSFQMPVNAEGTYVMMFRVIGGDQYLQTLVKAVPADENKD